MRTDNTLVCRTLPSVHRGVPDKQWSLGPFPFFVLAFTLDPEQDLLVLIEAECVPLS